MIDLQLLNQLLLKIMMAIRWKLMEIIIKFTAQAVIVHIQNLMIIEKEEIIMNRFN